MQRSYAAFRLLVAVLAATVLSSCAMMQSLGVPKPETFNQKVAVALGTVTQVRESALMLLMSQQITPDDADNINKSADVAREGINTARRMHVANPSAADSKLAAVRVALQALQAYLVQKGGG